MPSDFAKMLATRKHRIYDIREKQLNINLLAYYGGRPYINQRLSRFPTEGTISWAGNKGLTSEGRFSNTIDVIGRKDRSYLINHAARIAQKIKQYVFQVPPVRQGVDEDFLLNANQNGISLNTLMGKACNFLTVGGWSWLGIDAPMALDSAGNPLQMSVAQRAATGHRLFWNVYPATDVVDWYFDSAGNLQWLITETAEYDAPDPRKAGETWHVRALWEKGVVTRVRYQRKKFATTGDDAESIQEPQEMSIDFQEVPFVLVGEPSEYPWWFDDVEGINRSIMDLESANDEAMFQMVYPQMVLPKSLLDELQGQGESGADFARKVEAIVGLFSAISESPEDKGISRFITPDGGALKAIPDELTRKRKALFDVVGMALQAESRQVASAEAKEFDHLDPQAVLRERAVLLEEAETRAVQMSKEWDRQFEEYTPEYAKTFDISNLHEDIKAVVELQQVDMPDQMKKLLLQAVLGKIKKLGNLNITPEIEKAVTDEIEGMDFEAEIAMPPPPPQLARTDEGEQEGAA